MNDKYDEKDTHTIRLNFNDFIFITANFGSKRMSDHYVFNLTPIHEPISILCDVILFRLSNNNAIYIL